MKKTLITILLPIIVLIGFGYFTLFGFTFPPCGNSVTHIPLPEELEGATIVFDAKFPASAYYKVSLDKQYERCDKYTKMSKAYISSNSFSDGHSITTPVNPDTKFRILKFYVTSGSGGYAGGSATDFLLLEDSNGEKYYTYTYWLASYFVSGKKYKDLNDVLYNQRLNYHKHKLFQ